MQIAKELNRLVMWALKAEKERDYSEASYQCGKAFHDLAVMERNLARRQVDRITTALAAKTAEADKLRGALERKEKNLANREVCIDCGSPNLHGHKTLCLHCDSERAEALAQTPDTDQTLKNIDAVCDKCGENVKAFRLVADGVVSVEPCPYCTDQTKGDG